jgi:predicted nucleotidyltransferase
MAIFIGTFGKKISRIKNMHDGLSQSLRSKNTILFVNHGSYAYGLSTPESDQDYKGILIPDKKYFFGYLNRIEQQEYKNPDITVYEIRKFFKLAADCNPNIIEILWVDESDIVQSSIYGDKIIQNRDKFLSKKARYTFSGYAHSQLKRIKTHKKWLLNPVERKPLRADFNLPDTSVLSNDIIGAIQSLEIKGEDLNQFGPIVMEAYKRERSYHNALTEYTQYQNWKNTRNPKRAELERKYGYDCKHASHLVRLMRMCKEILTRGAVQVKRIDDRDELLAIKNGAWSYDKLLQWAEDQELEMEELYKSSNLPYEPNRNDLDQLCLDLVESFLEENV